MLSLMVLTMLLLFLLSCRSAGANSRASTGLRVLSEFRGGEVVAGRVKRVEKFGVFVELEGSNVVRMRERACHFVIVCVCGAGGQQPGAHARACLPFCYCLCEKKRA